MDSAPKNDFELLLPFYLWLSDDHDELKKDHDELKKRAEFWEENSNGWEKLARAEQKDHDELKKHAEFWEENSNGWEKLAKRAVAAGAARERAAIVAWLLAVDDEGGGSTYGLAWAIERGEHIVK